MLRAPVAFESWTFSAADKVRRNRLIFGYVIGASTVASGIAFVVLTSATNVEAQEEEEAKIVEVQLAKEPEPEPEPEPPPPELRPTHAANPGPRLPKLETPTTITNEKLEEKDAKPATSGSGDPYEKGGGDGSIGAQKAVVEAPAPPPRPPPAAPPVNKPRPVSEDDTPPEAIGSAVQPEYPPEIKAAGIEGTVLVRYVVTETGEVKDVKAVKGPPELFPVCVAAVKALRFKPAHDVQGNPISVVRYKSFRFHIRT
jgi:protein TonB